MNKQGNHNFKGDKTPMLEFTLKLLKDNPYMEKSYYKNLIPVSLSDIIILSKKRNRTSRQSIRLKDCGSMDLSPKNRKNRFRYGFLY